MPKEDQAKTRREKLEALSRQRISPYGGPFPKSESIEALVAGYADGRQVSTAGRLTAKRGHGGLAFADLRDASGKIQICLKQDRVGDAEKKRTEHLAGSGRPHGDGCDPSPESLPDFKSRFQGVEVLGVEDRRQGGPVDGAVLFNSVPGDVARVGDLFHAHNAIVAQSDRSCD